MNYNYFIDHSILTTDYEINLEYNPDYIPFTEKQNEFYSEHPDASYWEVVRCEMDPEPVPPAPPTIDEVKNKAKRYLSDLSLKTLGRFVLEYQLANAQTSLYELSLVPTADTIYDEAKAKEIISNYNSVGHELRNIYKQAEIDIDNCGTVVEINEYKDYYTNIYENYVYPNSNEE